MNELDCQKLVVDAVKEAGGQALKLQNRFLVGVVDLLVKLPDCHPMWLEAKKIDLSAKTVNHAWDVGCTKKQKDFLSDWHYAGMWTGVASFVQTSGVREPIRSVRMAVYEYELLSKGAYSRPPSEGPPLDWHVRQEQHLLLGDKSDRLGTIRNILREACKND